MSKELTQLFLRSINLSEFIDFYRSNTPHNNYYNDSPKTQRRIDSWRECVGGDDVLDIRLSVDGLTKNDLPFVLSATPDQSIIDQKLLNIFSEVIELAKYVSIDDRCLSLSKPLPFEQILLPFVIYARRELKSRFGQIDEYLLATAQVAIERELLKHLSWYSGQCFYVEFLVYQAALDPQRKLRSTKIVQSNSNDHPTTYYNSFVEKILRNNFLDFFLEYSSLARLLATCVQNWLDAKSMFLDCLITDYSKIQEILGCDSLGKIKQIKSGLSDSHDGGKRVLTVEFENDERIVFKPRPVGAETAFQKLVGWINGHSEIKFKLRPIKVVEGNKYGWVEYVPHKSCSSADQVIQYYYRAGILLAILNILRGGDYHSDNLIANGEYPIPVDFEVLFEPELTIVNGENGRSLDLAIEAYYNSVMGTGLLPTWREVRAGIVNDTSALGSMGGQITLRVYPVWQNINTDEMRLVDDEAQAETDSKENEVYLGEENVSVTGYKDYLQEGFTDAYLAITKNKESLVRSSGILIEFQKQQMRFVFRNTKMYYALLYTTCQPKFLREGIDRSIYLELLSRGLYSGSQQNTNSNLWKLLAYEKEALEGGEIPRFAYVPDRKALYSGGEIVSKEFFGRSGFEMVRERIESLSEQDLKLQSRFINLALLTRSIESGMSTEETKKSGLSSDIPDEMPEPLSSDEMLSKCVLIAEDLVNSSLQNAQSASWLDVTYDLRTEKYSIRPTGLDLYSGLSGIALFCASLFSLTGQETLLNLTQKTLSPITTIIEDEIRTRTLVNLYNIGGISGLGSIIYSLSTIGSIIRNDTYLDLALSLAGQLTAELIKLDIKFDVTSGSAGTILSLLKLHEITKEPQLLDTCRVCGDHLLQTQVSENGQLRGWLRKPYNSMLTGFSHGVSGIAYSLFKLAITLSTEEYLKAAINALQYESSLYSKEQKNWPDLRFNPPTYSTAWCHGATGILLTRLRMVEHISSSFMREDLNLALDTTLGNLHQKPDHLCCGIAGRIDALLIASEVLSEPALYDTAYETASSIVRESESAGGFFYHSKLPRNIFVPGLFPGVSGIGYLLLRLVHPDIFSSVLLLE